MKKYKVLVEFELAAAVEGETPVKYEVDSVVEFTEEVAAPLVAEGKLVEVTE